MISRRRAWSVAALLLVAAVPTVLNVYRPPAEPEPGSLAPRLAGPAGPYGAGEPGKHKEAWVADIFGARDFVTRRHLSPGGTGELALFAARTHDAKKLFHFPELALSYGHSVTARRMEDLPGPAGPLPVRVLEFRSPGHVHVAAYVLFYGTTPVRDPIPFLLRTLPRRFLGLRRPMTLLYVQGGAAADAEARVTADVRGLLAEASAAFLR